MSWRIVASGETYDRLINQNRIHKTTFSKITPKVYQAIYNVLKDKYFDVPKREE